MGDAVDRILGQWARERPDLETEAMGIFGRIYRVSAAAGAVMEGTYARFGISRGDFDVLATLRRSGAPYQLAPGALSESLMLTTGGMTGRLNRLDDAGLVTRSPAESDGRSVIVTLTSAGLELIDEAVGHGLSVQQELVAGMSARRRAELDRLLHDLLLSCEGYAHRRDRDHARRPPRRQPRSPRRLR